MALVFRDHNTGALRTVGGISKEPVPVLDMPTLYQRHIELQESHEKTKQDLLDALDRLHVLERSHLELLDTLAAPAPPPPIPFPDTPQ